MQSLALRGGIVPVRLWLVAEPALEADDRDDRVRQADRIARHAALADVVAVLVIAEVAHIMDPVPDFPVPAAPRQHLTRPGHVRTERSDAVYRFRRGLAGLEHGSFAHDAKGLAVARQRHEALVIVARSKHIALQTGRGPCRRSRDRSCRPIEASAGPAHGGPVALDHHDVIGLPGNDQCCGFPATVQGVQGQRPPRHIQFLDQLAGGDDLAAGEAVGGHLAAGRYRRRLAVEGQ